MRGQLVERTEKDYRAFVRRWEADGQPPPAEWVKTMSSPATRRNARAALIWWHRVELGKTLDIPGYLTPSVYRPPTRRRSWRCFATRLMGFVAFRVFTPNEVFPVTYRRGRAAHLDVGGRRGDAIRTAVHDQLGLTVLEAKPVGLEGSGGSTPLRLRVAAADKQPERYLFAKLYAKSHVRADRWYKLGRTILYGALEDEAPFQSVRRFVEYEDYTLLRLHDLGLPTPVPPKPS